jgi:hypothetical protein
MVARNGKTSAPPPALGGLVSGAELRDAGLAVAAALKEELDALDQRLDGRLKDAEAQVLVRAGKEISRQVAREVARALDRDVGRALAWCDKLEKRAAQAEAAAREAEKRMAAQAEAMRGLIEACDGLARQAAGLQREVAELRGAHAERRKRKTTKSIVYDPSTGRPSKVITEDDDE